MYQRDLITKLLSAANSLANKSRKGSSNYILVGSDNLYLYKRIKIIKNILRKINEQ